MKAERVAVFVPSPFLGGVGMCLMNYLRHLDSSRFALDFFVRDDPPPRFADEIRAHGGRIVRVPGFGRPLRYVCTVGRLLREGRYGIVHANLNTLNAFALCAAWRAGVPVRLAHSHVNSSWREPLRHLAKLALRPWANLFATRFLACSELAGRWQFGRKAFESGAVTLVRNAIDLGRFAFDPEKRADVRRRYGLGEAPVVGFVGRLVTQKNPGRMLDVFAELVRRHPETRLLVIGDGSLLPALRAKAQAIGCAGKVTFAGRQDDPAEFYSAMDVFLFPSLYEGLGMTLVEAQANGLPGVASDRVPREADVTATVDFVPLDASDAVWADRLASRIASGRLPDDCRERIRAAGYDICAAASALERIYATS